MYISNLLIKKISLSIPRDILLSQAIKQISMFRISSFFLLLSERLFEECVFLISHNCNNLSETGYNHWQGDLNAERTGMGKNNNLQRRILAQLKT